MATPSWNTPIACTTCCLTSGTQTISKFDKKWSATAIKASFGQRLNQSIVHPLIRPGNLSDLLRNFSPTWARKRKEKTISLTADLDEIDPCRGHECICFLFHFLTQKAQHLSNCTAELCGLDIYLVIFTNSCEYEHTGEKHRTTWRLCLDRVRK